jgi:WD40 repeat protein
MMPTLTCLSLSTSKVISLHFSKQGRVLYSASMDGVICELDTCTGKSKDTFKTSKKSINHLTISHGKCIFYLHFLLPYACLKDPSIKVPRVCCIHGKIFTYMYGLFVKQCELH